MEASYIHTQGSLACYPFETASMILSKSFNILLFMPGLLKPILYSDRDEFSTNNGRLKFPTLNYMAW